MHQRTEATVSKVIVITGAGSGIGRATARKFLSRGHSVVLAGRRLAELAETAQADPNALAVATDVTQAADVAHLFSQAVEKFGRVDVLFNNAGAFGPSASVDELDESQWEQVMKVNVTGSMLCAAEAVRVMKSQRPQGGKIINNGSISAHSPRPRAVAYTVSKHAITGLTKAIDLDGRAFNITAGQIDIGNTATEMTSGFAAGTGALQANGSYVVEPTFPVDDAANAVLLMAELPASANIGSLIIAASGMPFIGRG